MCFSPPFLGKSLNVVRECGHDVTCPAAKEVIYTLKERAYVEQIEKAFGYASKVLLGFLMEEKELVAHLRCAASSWGEGARGPPEVHELSGSLPSRGPSAAPSVPFWWHLLHSLV